jgi:hypothetical protein
MLCAVFVYYFDFYNKDMKLIFQKFPYTNMILIGHRNTHYYVAIRNGRRLQALACAFSGTVMRCTNRGLWTKRQGSSALTRRDSTTRTKAGRSYVSTLNVGRTYHVIAFHRDEECAVSGLATSYFFIRPNAKCWQRRILRFSSFYCS